MLIQKLNIFRNEHITAENTFQYLKGYLKKSDFILDVGSGTGILAELIKKEIRSTIRCIDVTNINKTNLSLIIFNGKNIPFNDNTFSVVLCCFVLHHSQNQEKLIKEMKRVSKSKIFIFEDIPLTFFDRIMFKFHSLHSEMRYKSRRLEFHNMEEWKEIFEKNNLNIEKIIEIKKSRQLWYPVSRRLFILKKQKA